jgi:hypothetical protein
MSNLLTSIVLHEGIQHIEDLPLREFIRTVEALKDKVVTEKLDGANLWFGLDDKGFFTSREGKSPRRARFYDVSDYPHVASSNAFRAAHLALEKVEPVIRKYLKTGDMVEMEVLFGRQPNTVTYGSEGKNYIVLLRGVNGTPDERVHNLAEALNGKTETVASTIITSPDGNKLDNKDEKIIWKFTKVAPIQGDKINTKQAVALLAKMKAFIDEKNKAFPDKTNAEISEMALTGIPKDKRDAAKQERARLNEYIMTTFKSPIKELLLNNFVRKIKPFLQDKKLGPGEDIGVEGVVVRDPITGSQTKIVDKDVFTAINSFNSAVRNNISGLVRTTDNTATIEMQGGVFGQAKIKIAELLGAKELALSAGTRRFLDKFKGSDAQATALNLAKHLGLSNISALRTKISAILMGSLKEVDGILNSFKKEAGEFKLKLKTGKEIGISPEIMKRTFTSFAETKKEITEVNSNVLKSRNASELIMALYGKTLGQLFSEGESDVKESIIDGGWIVVFKGRTAESGTYLSKGRAEAKKQDLIDSNPDYNQDNLQVEFGKKVGENGFQRLTQPKESLFQGINSLVEGARDHLPPEELHAGMAHNPRMQNKDNKHQDSFIAHDSEGKIHKDLHKKLQAAGYKHDGTVRHRTGWHKNYIHDSGNWAQVEHMNGTSKTHLSFFKNPLAEAAVTEGGGGGGGAGGGASGGTGAGAGAGAGASAGAGGGGHGGGMGPGFTGGGKGMGLGGGRAGKGGEARLADPSKYLKEPSAKDPNAQPFKMLKGNKVVTKKIRNFERPKKFPMTPPETTGAGFIAPYPYALFGKKKKKVGEDAGAGTSAAGAVAAFAMPVGKANKPISRIPLVDKKPKKYALIAAVNETNLNEDGFGHLSDMKFATDVSNNPRGTNDVQFNQLRNNVAIDGEVTPMNVNRYLDKAHEINDSVDTITFGLETDTGAVAKVYVNVTQADEFERALAALLGKENDLEKVVNDLAMKFDIVDVEWPKETVVGAGQETPSPDQSIDDANANGIAPEDNQSADGINFNLEPEHAEMAADGSTGDGTEPEINTELELGDDGEGGEEPTDDEEEDESEAPGDDDDDDESPTPDADDSDDEDEGDDEDTDDEDEDDDGVERDDFGQIIDKPKKKKKKKKKSDDASDEPGEEPGDDEPEVTEESVNLVEAAPSFGNVAVQSIADMLVAMGFDLIVSRSYTYQANQLIAKNSPGLIAARSTTVANKLAIASAALTQAIQTGAGAAATSTATTTATNTAAASTTTAAAAPATTATFANPAVQLISTMLTTLGFDITSTHSFSLQMRQLIGHNSPALFAAKQPSVVAKLRAARDTLAKSLPAAPGAAPAAAQQGSIATPVAAGFSLIGSIIAEQERGPRLAALMKSGKVFKDRGEYVGVADDGTEVSIGNVGEEAKVEKYLEAHPTPDTW